MHRFGKFRLDAADRRLWCENEPVSLTPKQFDLLFYFVKNAGRSTRKSELLDAIWADTYVEETTLARNVSWLREKLGSRSDGGSYIETVPKVGYRFTPDVTFEDVNSDTLIVEEHIVQHVRATETITVEPSPKHETVLGTRSRLFTSSGFVAASLLLIAFIGSGLFIYTNSFQGRGVSSAPNIEKEGAHASNNPAAVARQSEHPQIKIGSIVNLQNRYPNDGSYLDAWGAVWSKPEFRQVPTQTMFVSTHIKPNRDNGSGSWEIVSANGKEAGEQLVIGDRIHLRNMYPNAGYLDACGWTEHLRVFEKFRDQSGAVFTTRSPNRDNGTGIWTIRSATLTDGTPIFEGDSIAIESSYFINDAGKNRVSGFLNVAGKVSDIPVFDEYNGSKLVFTKTISYDQPIPDIWTITVSKAGVTAKK